MTTHNKLKAAQTMTTGVSTSKLELGASITLHGHVIKITHTDDTDTTVQYANLARRTFDTHTLNSYLELGTFPVGTTFERPLATPERAVIEAATGDCCYQVRITAGSAEPRHETYSYADFIAWHMDNGVNPIIHLEFPILKEEDNKIVKSLEDIDASMADDSNPFEDELQTALDSARAEIDDLRTQLRESKAALLTQNALHNTELLAKSEQIERLEAKAAILNPTPTRKEYCIKYGVLDTDLNNLAGEGWQVQHMQFTNDNKLNVVFVRDLPAEQPRARMPVQEAVLPHIGAVPLTPRPPVRQPPMPSNQIIMGQPTSRALTHNGPRPGDTRKVTVPADDPVIKEAFERGQATYDRKMAVGTSAINQASRSFNQGV